MWVAVSPLWVVGSSLGMALGLQVSGDLSGVGGWVGHWGRYVSDLVEDSGGLRRVLQ